MDLMSRAVEQMRLRRTTFVVRELPSPFDDRHARGSAGLHLILSGHARFDDGHVERDLGPGDLLLLPQAAAHRIQSAPGSSAVTRVLTGELAFQAPDHPLLSVLPAAIHAPPALLARSPRCLQHLEQLAEEVQNPRDGTAALATCLTEMLVIETMRFFTPPAGVECPVGGWFSGLSDPAVRSALVAIHRDPAAPWSVDSLARLAGKSRSAFAAHFSAVMKETPAAYLTRWRLFQARALLRQTELSLEDVALRVGYGSAAAFSLAFTREHGQTPGNYRRAQRDVRIEMTPSQT